MLLETVSDHLVTWLTRRGYEPNVGHGHNVLPGMRAAMFVHLMVGPLRVFIYEDRVEVLGAQRAVFPLADPEFPTNLHHHLASALVRPDL